MHNSEGLGLEPLIAHLARRDQYAGILLSAVLNRHHQAGDQTADARLPKTSPVAWQSILFLGRYAFHGPRQPIDFDALLATSNLLNMPIQKNSEPFRGFGLRAPTKTKTDQEGKGHEVAI